MFIFGLLLLCCSCKEPAVIEQGKQGPPPPAPPDPFPIEMSTLLDQLTRSDTEGIAKIRIRVWTNVEYNENVIVKYTLYELKDNRQDEIETKEIFNKKINVNEKSEWDETIILPSFGHYRILIQAEYNGSGQEAQYIIQFTDKLIKSGI